MSKDKTQDHHDLANQFIQLANKMKEEGSPIAMINASLMSASGVYATYTAVGGDEGGLNDSGINVVVKAYKTNLKNIQKIKQEQAALAVSK